MKKEAQQPNPGRPEESPSSRNALFGRISIPFFGDKDRMPVRTRRRLAKGKWSRWSLLALTLICAVVWLALDQCKRAAFRKGVQKLSEVSYDHYLYRYDDCDFQLYQAQRTCSRGSVLIEDYREYLEAERKREELEKESKLQTSVSSENFIRQRPKINVNRLAYYEKLTRDRVRLVYDNGACEILPFKDLLYNIQEAKQCTGFVGIPRNGEVTEFVNLLYIESFDKVLCKGKELYRANLAVTASSCAILRTIRDCGVGLFSVYVYRNLRKRLEELNPHVDFRYRRLVEEFGCEC